jgi:hypothetical protein
MKFDKNKIKIIICAIAGTTLSWFINHEIGFGAIVASGLVGVIAAILLPASLAGTAYTASFVGMSSTSIIPSLGAALLAGLIVGIMIIFTTEIYAGIGGKGGTTAALSTIITKIILGLFS